MRTAQPLALGHSGIAAFAIDQEAPVMALVGVLRPRLLVTRGLLAALTGEELAASVAHEVGHWRAWDNLKRLVMRAAPDLLTMTSTARDIERRWSAAAEHAVRRALASASFQLDRVERITPTLEDVFVSLIEARDRANAPQTEVRR